MLEELLDLARKGGAIPKAAGQGESEKTALYMIVNSPKEHYGPLLEASLLARDIPALSLLLSRGADPADSTVSYGSPLELVLCEHDDDDDEVIIDIIELFFRYGADPNQVCMHGSSLIAQLAPGDEANIMGFILQHGADVDFQDKDGQTCLMQSAMWGSPDCLRLLLDCGANVNIADQEGRTALMHACAPQHFDEDDREIMAQNFAELLVAAGADIGAKDFQDRTAADYAAEHGLYKVESFLRTRTLGGVSIPG